MATILMMYSVSGLRPAGQNQHDATVLRAASVILLALQLAGAYWIWLHRSGQRGVVG